MTIKFTIMGCGSSFGVPRADGNWGKCDPYEKKNYRTRCSAMLSTTNMNILFDTSPDLRTQLLRESVKNINKVFISHEHGDQTHGINDLRIFYLKNQKKIDIFSSNNTKKYLKKNFSYCFKSTKSYPAILEFKKLKKIITFNGKNKIFIRPINVEHGEINCLAFVINNKCAYASDVSKFHVKDLKYLKNLKYLVIDCLRFTPHPSHFNLEQALNLIEKLKPKKAILTNLHCELDYKYLKNILPKNVEPAYDGLTLDL